MIRSYEDEAAFVRQWVESNGIRAEQVQHGTEGSFLIRLVTPQGRSWFAPCVFGHGCDEESAIVFSIVTGAESVVFSRRFPTEDAFVRHAGSGFEDDPNDPIAGTVRESQTQADEMYSVFGEVMLGPLLSGLLEVQAHRVALAQLRGRFADLQGQALPAHLHEEALRILGPDDALAPDIDYLHEATDLQALAVLARNLEVEANARSGPASDTAATAAASAFLLVSDHGSVLRLLGSRAWNPASAHTFALALIDQARAALAADVARTA